LASHRRKHYQHLWKLGGALSKPEPIADFGAFQRNFRTLHDPSFFLSALSGSPSTLIHGNGSAQIRYRIAPNTRRVTNRAIVLQQE
jgi:hypothetical protein